MSYILNGREVRYKNKLVLEVVKKYVNDNPTKTYEELKLIFNDKIQGSIGVIKNTSDYEQWTMRNNTKRFFINEPISLNDGNTIYVCTEWGSSYKNNSGDLIEGNFEKFVELSIELGFTIEEIKRDETSKKKESSYDTKIGIKNIMLYGAPGVGKTYNYKKLVSLIESGNFKEKEIFDFIINNKDDEIEEGTIDELYKKIKDEKRIEFVTFHQSYSYEDFIEGFRPNENGEIELDKYGIFKKICKDAETNYSKSNDIKEVLFKDAINILLKEKIENEEHVQIKLKRKNSFYKIYDFNEKTIFFEKQNGDKSHSLALKTLEKMYDEEENNAVVGGLAPYYNPLLEELLKIKKTSKVEKVERKNYYIVIDEINRGNISKIFGELITLIEEDKRDTYEVTLPYSKEKFKIPSNLYIIATMNSTDKSIATIDIALRRRFTFLKMKPNPVLVKNEEAQKLMKVLNQYIKNSSLGEDYQLGHSYFMKVKDNEDLEFIIKYKIKPLLEEYFYSDDKTPKQIIEEAFKEYKEEEKLV